MMDTEQLLKQISSYREALIAIAKEPYPDSNIESLYETCRQIAIEALKG